MASDGSRSRVQLLAYTSVNMDVAEKVLDYPWYADSKQIVDGAITDADYLAELTGRDCYQSHHRPNDATAHTEDYVTKNLVAKQHYSVLEHSSATLRFTGVSRSLTHELVRHRHLSFSQLSQRYVEQTDMALVIPPDIRDWPNLDERQAMINELAAVWQACMRGYSYIEDTLRGHPVPVSSGEYLQSTNVAYSGLSVKRARSAARAVLPNMTGTIIDVTGNHRAWREVIQKRIGVGAEEEIKEVFKEVLAVLRVLAPAVYADIQP